MMNLNTKANRYAIAKECPCGKDNKDNKFNPCTDDPNAGYCFSCGKTFFPKNQSELYKNSHLEVVKQQPDNTKVQKIMSDFKSNFHIFAESFVGIDLKNEFEKWHIGTHHYKTYQKTTFGLANSANTIIGLKYVQYQENGKREKTQFPSYEPKCERCLFGLHLYEKNKNKPCILVESEKTAFLSAMYLQSEYNFLAIGGANMLKEEMVYPLINNEVYYFCDNDEAGTKNKGIEILKGFAERKNIKLKIINPFSDKDKQEYKGYDLADYLVECGKKANLIQFAKDIKKWIYETPYYELEKAKKSIENIENNPKQEANDDQPKKNKLHIGVFYTYDEFRDKLTIDSTNFIEILKTLGFVRFDEDNKTHCYVHIKGNIIYKIHNLNYMRDIFYDWLKNNHKDTLISLKKIENKVINNSNFLFNDNVLSRLIPEKSFVFKKEAEKEDYIFYKNVAVLVNKNGYYEKSYNDLDFFVWEDQINERNFISNPNKGQFEQFCELVSEATNKPKHFESLKTIIGYLLHDYTGGQRKAINFTDCALERGKEGRSGKTLLGKAFAYIRNLAEINGKSFKADNPRRYSIADRNTQIIHINDLHKNFSFEDIYNDITECVEVSYMYNDPFQIKPKIILSSNRPLVLSTGSDRNRVIEFEFSDYFTEHYSPFEEFGSSGILNKQWGEAQWQMFDYFMIDCVVSYFKTGILHPQNTLLEKRKILYELGDIALYFEKYECGIEYNKEKEFSICKSEFFSQITSQTKFTQFLKKYCDFLGLDYQERRDRKGGETNFYFTLLRKIENKI